MLGGVKLKATPSAVLTTKLYWNQSCYDANFVIFGDIVGH